MCKLFSNLHTLFYKLQEIIKRAEHPAYGYYIPTKEYYESIIRWHRKRNGVKGLTAKDIGYENGVLGCVSSAIQAFTVPGEKILLHSPTYIGFTHVFEDTGRVAELSPLKKDENGVWRMDYDDMDKRLSENHIHLAILCSPHNPCGRVWSRDELEFAVKTNFVNAEFENCDLSDATIAECLMMNSTMKNCNLDNTNLSDCDGEPEIISDDEAEGLAPIL